MRNIYKPVEKSWRLTPEYAEARMLFEERRLAQTRVAEIDFALRNLSKEEPEAVQAAHNEIPFRKPHGRPKSGESSSG
jgi:hypothetical protein